MGSSSSGKRQRGLRVPPARHPDVPLSPGLPTGWADSDSARGRGALLCPPFPLPVSGSPPSRSPGSFKPATLSSPKPSLRVSPKRPVLSKAWRPEVWLRCPAHRLQWAPPQAAQGRGQCSQPSPNPSKPPRPALLPQPAPRRRTAARAPHLLLSLQQTDTWSLRHRPGLPGVGTAGGGGRRALARAGSQTPSQALPRSPLGSPWKTFPSSGPRPGARPRPRRLLSPSAPLLAPPPPPRL